jgi:hypothetical protein
MASPTTRAVDGDEMAQDLYHLPCTITSFMSHGLFSIRHSLHRSI